MRAGRVLLLSLLLAPFAAPTAEARHRCRTAGDTVVQTEYSRVLVSRYTGTTYVCFRRRGKLYRLDDPEDVEPAYVWRSDRDDDVPVREGPKLAGRYVGFYLGVEFGTGDIDYGLQVFDVRMGKYLRDVRTGDPSPFVLKFNGSAAFASEYFGNVSVVAVDSPELRVLDEGPKISEDSLRLSRDHRFVLWKNARKTRRARLN